MIKQTTFNSMEEFTQYQAHIFKEAAVKELVEKVNDRFEDKLRHAVTVRHEIRTGIRQSNEKIAITIYGWIQKFMSLTHKTEIIKPVQIGNKKGSVELHLYNQTSRFIEDDEQ